MDPDPALSSVAFEMPKKLVFFPEFFCFFLTVGIFTTDRDTKSLRRHKTVEIKVFLNFLAC
jgi:hypothetical protein